MYLNFNYVFLNIFTYVFVFFHFNYRENSLLCLGIRIKESCLWFSIHTYPLCESGSRAREGLSGFFCSAHSIDAVLLRCSNWLTLLFVRLLTDIDLQHRSAISALLTNHSGFWVPICMKGSFLLLHNFC